MWSLFINNCYIWTQIWDSCFINGIHNINDILNTLKWYLIHPTLGLYKNIIIIIIIF